MARPGVFERAVEVTNLLRPAFAIQLGDTIEGYTTDPQALRDMWEEIDAITAALEVPFYRIPGNHDVGNDLMREEWLRRNGPLHYHFRFEDVLFLMLDTQDPPGRLLDMLRPVDPEARERVPPALDEFIADLTGRRDEEIMAELGTMLRDQPSLMRDLLSSVKGGTQPARISEEQVVALERAIAEHADVRWTVVCMHIPAWQGRGHPALERLRNALGDRPYVVFAGHCHNYQHSAVHGRVHIRLGTSGAVRLAGAPDGDFDHVALVTMAADGPRIANIVLDGVIGEGGGRFSPTPVAALG
jgi:3',5'-cyclic AMP phosphodiesterase CpdA